MIDAGAMGMQSRLASLEVTDVRSKQLQNTRSILMASIMKSGSPVLV